MIARVVARFPLHVLAGALCGGIAGANAERLRSPATPVALLFLLVCAATATEDEPRLVLLALALALAGWWWGSVRLDALDRSPLANEIGRAGRAVAVVTAPARRARFAIRVTADVTRWKRRELREPALLELPLGRAPPQGAVLEVLARAQPPRGSVDGFDESAYLRRHGIHVVLRVDRWRVVGRRGGLGGVADRLRRRIELSLRGGADGERGALLAGVVLGADEGLSEELRDRFRASGLYHLLAVSGQNVALIAGGVLLCAWLLGIARWIGEVAALACISGYVLAVGAQPSVVRAGVAGALGSFAWLAARQRDRWYFMLLGALALLAWNPYTLLDPGFQLSFGAVIAIFTIVPRIQRALEGYPIPRMAVDVLAVSTACGVATAPILWLQFGSIPLLSVPANALAAPAVVPLLGLAFVGAAAHPFAPEAAAALVALAAACAAYVAWWARAIGALPFAQVEAGWAVAVIAAAAATAAAYAWRR